MFCAKNKHQIIDTPPLELCDNDNLVLVFDTETTIDQYQNLKFGSYGIWENDKLDEFGLFYDNNLDNNDVKTLSDYADKII